MSRVYLLQGRGFFKNFSTLATYFVENVRQGVPVMQSRVREIFKSSHKRHKTGTQSKSGRSNSREDIGEAEPDPAIPAKAESVDQHYQQN